jgi:hypothetical protein
MVSHGEGSSNLERRANELPECAYKAGTNIRIQLFFFGFHTLMKRAVILHESWLETKNICRVEIRGMSGSRVHAITDAHPQPSQCIIL